MWSHLGGVGFRGPGETQLETDRRLVKERIYSLRRGLGDIRARKEREVRTREAFTVAIVGYTNAGKSTLMNALTDAGVYVADQLFATLETRTRPWKVAPRRSVLVSDTVGFIDNLPHNLVESFHATLEEVLTADLLLHVVDASHRDPYAQFQSVKRVLEQIGCAGKPELTALNKIDKVSGEELLPWLEHRVARPVRISALTGDGLDKLAAEVARISQEREGAYEVSIDVREGAAIAAFEAAGELEGKRVDGETLRFKIRALPDVVRRAAARARDASHVAVSEVSAPPALAAEPTVLGHDA
jgi:GTP-binding protein HflX